MHLFDALSRLGSYRAAGSVAAACWLLITGRKHNITQHNSVMTEYSGGGTDRDPNRINKRCVNGVPSMLAFYIILKLSLHNIPNCTKLSMD